MPNYCSHCVLPETRPGVKLGPDGICQGCTNALTKTDIDWPGRAQAFARVAARARSQGRDYDCVIPVSGGKDSFWQVVTCLEHDLRPLCVTYAVPGRNALGQENLNQLIQIGVDHIDFKPNPRVERAFVERAFRDRGISGLVTHMGIFSLPIQIAVAHDVPLVVYGENSAFEYGTEDESLIGARLDSRWREAFGVTDGTTADDWVGDGIGPRDLSPYRVPPDSVLNEKDIRAVFLGHYFSWDPERSLEIARAHGFQSRTDGPLVGHYDFANIDDDLLGIHQHTKWYKFGISRSWDTLSMEIRQGRLDRAQAIEDLAKRADETPWGAIEAFCRYLGISEHDYFETLEKFRNPEIWSRKNGRWEIEGFLLPDFEWPEDHV